jgi:hypothetical protein
MRMLGGLEPQSPSQSHTSLVVEFTQIMMLVHETIPSMIFTIGAWFQSSRRKYQGLLMVIGSILSHTS